MVGRDGARFPFILALVLFALITLVGLAPPGVAGVTERVSVASDGSPVNTFFREHHGEPGTPDLQQARSVSDYCVCAGLQRRAGAPVRRLTSEALPSKIILKSPDSTLL